MIIIDTHRLLFGVIEQQAGRLLIGNAEHLNRVYIVGCLFKEGRM